MYQYGVKLLNDNSISDDEVIMSLPTDDQGFADYAYGKELREGEGYGTEYVIVRRKVGEWEVVE